MYTKPAREKQIGKKVVAINLKINQKNSFLQWFRVEKIFHLREDCNFEPVL